MIGTQEQAIEANEQRYGPRLTEHETRFSVWAPGAGQVELILAPGEAGEHRLAMEPAGEGFFCWACAPSEAGPGTRYLLCRDDLPALPDPASRFQPDGVLGPSEVIDLEQIHVWSDHGWPGLPPEELVIYELHVGTFTPAGTYRGVNERLDHLADLGVTALELMPLAAFAGARNWGYDGVFHFAPFAGYGRPEQLMQLVDDCHRRGIAVILDLVTNHFGSEGNAMWSLAPDFFRPDRPTAWSAGLQWEADPVLLYFDEAAAFWLRDYHLDGLRLDAFHAVPNEHRLRHLQRMIAAIEQTLPAGRQTFVLLESVDNQTSLLHCGTERVRVAQLNFDFQRAGHALLTGERHREYADYSRPAQELGRCLDEGFAFQGRRSSYHRRVRGEQGSTPASWTHVVNFLQNHDTSGNRYLGQRLDELVRSHEALRAATALLLLHPGIPFLFMGQEWGARTPFHFFTDLPEELGRVTQAGRLELFWEVDPATCPQKAPGCQDPEAFSRSALRWSELDQQQHREHLEFVRLLLEVRRQVLPRMSLEVTRTEVEHQGACFTVRIGQREPGSAAWLLVANLGSEALDLDPGETSELVFSSMGRDLGSKVPPKTTRLYRL